jgi:hypothetical protein
LGEDQLHKTENSLREGQGKGARQKGGIGFYSYNQIKNTRPAGRIGAMLIGGIYVLVGLFVIVRLINVRKAEAHIWGSAEPHTIGFIFGVCLIGIGAFAVHVGVIYYSRKLCRWASAGRRHPK